MIEFMQRRGAQAGMTGDPLYEPLGWTTAPGRRTESRWWRRLATIAVAGCAVAVLGAIELLDPDRPRAAVVAVAPIEPAPSRPAAPPGPAPSRPSADEPAATVAAVADTGAAQVSMENGVKVIRLNPGRRTEGDASVSHGAAGAGVRALGPSVSAPR